MYYLSYSFINLYKGHLRTYTNELVINNRHVSCTFSIFNLVLSRMAILGLFREADSTLMFILFSIMVGIMTIGVFIFTRCILQHLGISDNFYRGICSALEGLPLMSIFSTFLDETPKLFEN